MLIVYSVLGSVPGFFLFMISFSFCTSPIMKYLQKPIGIQARSEPRCFCFPLVPCFPLGFSNVGFYLCSLLFITEIQHFQSDINCSYSCIIICIFCPLLVCCKLNIPNFFCRQTLCVKALS
jgi:hypothetical protein